MENGVATWLGRIEVATRYGSRDLAVWTTCLASQGRALEFGVATSS